jgi:uncharacterized protein (DUF488 family)
VTTFTLGDPVVPVVCQVTAPKVGVKGSLFTVGYQQTSLTVMLEKLESQGIQMVLDVREVAWSRKPGFSAKQLESTLIGRGIEYQHDRLLGTPRSIRQHYRLSGDWEVFRLQYSEHLQSISDLVRSYVSLLRSKRVCLLCFEREAELCHRSLLAEAFGAEAGFLTCHL